MMLHEGERLAYLQALGIAQYVPLRPMAGVPQLPPLQWDVQPEPVLQPAQEEIPEPQPVPPAETVAQAVAELTQRTDTASPRTASPHTAEPAHEPAPPIFSDIPLLDAARIKGQEEKKSAAPKAAPLQRFALAVINIPQRARLLVELSQPDAPGLSGAEFRLLSDLFLALNIKQDINDSSTRLYRWPLVKNPRIAADVNAARDGLLAFLAAAQSEQAQAKLVCLGTTPLLCFPRQQAGDIFELPDVSNTACLFTHSLSSLQKDWTLKSQLWRQLQSFL